MTYIVDENCIKCKKYAEKWPVITTRKEPPKDWKQWDGVPNKYKDHFSEKSGTGD